MADGRIRLYVDQPYEAGQPLALDPEQSHYLMNVMRVGSGEAVLIFNGRQGEWSARLDRTDRRRANLVPEHQTRPQGAPVDLWLLFAPLKKTRTDYLVEKAVELGVSRLLPVETRRTNADRLRVDKLAAHAREAAEQCGATWVPEVVAPQPLTRVLETWPAGRRIAMADEARAGQPAGLPPDAPGGPWAILIGPEGGFSPEERKVLELMPFLTQFGLGPRILRADTAAVAAVALWQVRIGDWR